MYTKGSLNNLIKKFKLDIDQLSLNVTKMTLFGSYINGGVHPNSDIDIAIWADKFTGDPLEDLEIIRPLIRIYRDLDIKTFPSYATKDDFPFIEIIEKTGKDINHI